MYVNAFSTDDMITYISKLLFVENNLLSSKRECCQQFSGHLICWDIIDLRNYFVHHSTPAYNW